MAAQEHRRWEHLPEEELLDLRFCDLGLGIPGTPLERRVARLQRELSSAGLRFRPHVWLSTDWFTPDGVAGFAVPFYLAHPRLARLEKRHMLEVEGGSEEWCMKLMRHEAAHALDNAYRLRRRRRWREAFGAFTTPYRQTYVPRPTSRHFVQNLDYWYAQSHPCEDFAETFAVWLRPRSGWRKRYAGWPALEKLRTLDALVAEIAQTPPRYRSRARPGVLSGVRTRLRQHYLQKQARYHDELTTEYDAPLLRVFAAEGAPPGAELAARFLVRHRGALRRHVGAVTGQHPYLISQVLNDLKLRCRKLGLRVVRSEEETLLKGVALVTVLTLDFLVQPSEYRR